MSEAELRELQEQVDFYKSQLDATKQSRMMEIRELERMLRELAPGNFKMMADDCECETTKDVTEDRLGWFSRQVEQQCECGKIDNDTAHRLKTMIKWQREAQNKKK